MKPDDERWTALAPRLAAERRESSFMALLLDHEVEARAVESSGPGSRVLDYGAGDGRLAMAVARGGATVDALEPTPGQFHELLAAADESGSSVRALDTVEALRGPYDVALCVNVLDHIEDWTATISTMVHLVRPGGRVLIVVPHPLKDLGDWRRLPAAWPAESYRDYVLDDYLLQGPCRKNREDRNGNVIARALPSFHRTVSTYYNGLRDKDLDVGEMLEPAPDPRDAAVEPVLYAKCSRIPYFLMFDCTRRHHVGSGAAR